jgi:hypothetical protein
MKALEAGELVFYLRRCGLVVHHAAEMPGPLDGSYHAFVVFLEANLGQHELAAECAGRMSGVFNVAFSGHTKSIMYVLSSSPTAAAACEGAAPSR